MDESGSIDEKLFEEETPDVDDLMDEESGEPTNDWVIILYHNNQEILRLPAKASSTEELRENYIKMFGRINASGDVKVKVYYKDTNGHLHLVAEHLF